MNAHQACFFVSDTLISEPVIAFVKNSGLDLDIHIYNALSYEKAASADLIFVDETIMDQQCDVLAGIKAECPGFLPVLLLSHEKTDGVKKLPACVDDIVLQSFSQPVWKHRLEIYLQLHDKDLVTRNEESKFKVLFTESHSIMLLIDPKTGKIADANRAACKFYGYTHSKLTSMKIQQINKLSDNQVKQAIKKVRTNEKNNFVFQHHLADGSVKTVEVHSGNVIYEGKSLLYSVIYDITEKIKAEQLLSESIENYRKLIENAPDIVILIDKTGTIRFVNQRIKEYGNYLPEEIVGKPVADFILSEDHQRALEAIQRVFNNQQEAPYFKSSLLLKDGRKIPIITKGVSVKFNGEILNMTVIRDISFIKEAEIKLRESRETFQDIFNNSSVAIYIQDKAGRFLDINKAALKQYGYTDKSRLIGKTPEFVAAEGKNDFSQIKEYLLKAFKGKPQQFEFWAKRCDGYIFPKLVLVEKGTYFGKPVVYNFSFDLSERKKMEETLRESESKFNSIFNSSPSPAHLVNENFEVVLANDKILKIKGYTLKEVQGKKCYEVFQGKTRVCDNCGVRRVFQEHKLVSSENTLIQTDGQTRYFRTLAYPVLDKDKKVKYVVESTVDITKEKLVSQKLKQSETQYHNLFQYMKNCVAVYEVQDNGDIIIKDFNRAAEKLEKVRKEDVVGKELRDVFPGVEKFGIYQAIKDVYKTGKPVSMPVKSYQDNHITGWRENYLYKLPSGEIVAIYNDVTEQKVTEERLKESENKYRSLAETFSDLILTFDLNGKLTYISPSVKKITGFTAEEVLNREFWSFLVPEYIETTLEKFKRGIGGEEIPLYEIELLHKNGSRIPIELNVTSLFDAEGKPMGRLAVARDITERKRAEKALRESEKKYREQSRLFRLMSDNIPDMVWAKDLEGRFVFTNKAFAKKFLIAKDTDEPIGKKDPFFAERQRNLHPNNNEWFTFDIECSDSDALVLKLKKPVRILESGFIQGKLLHLDVYKAPIFNEKGLIVGIVGHGRDVTKEKEAEKALLLRDKALNAAANAIIITTADGKIEWINRAFTSLSGFTVEESIGKQMGDLVGSEKQDKAFFENLNKILASGQVWKGELIDKRKDGSLYEVEEVITPVTNEKGQVEHLIGIMTEITERKAAERELKAAKEAAEESSRLKSAFLANMNHEIRTPMNAIMGFSELMMDATPEEKENYANIVNVSAGQLMNLIDDVIFLSRLQSEKLPVHTVTFYPADLLKEVFVMFDLPEMKKNLELKMQLPEKAETIAMQADADKIRQVMTNFVSNAIKYTQEGYVKLGFEVRETTIVFYVEDSGMGISEAEQQHIFEAFYRSTEAVNAAIRGTGLGLNIAKELVELMGGTIGVSSQLKKGSRFFFTLPYMPAKIMDMKPASTRQKSKKWEDLNILVAEDDNSNYLYLAVLLKGKVNGIDRALNGQEAIEMVREKIYDIVLMDLKMPVMSGYEATRKIKKQFPRLPVIATTAYSTPEEKKRALDAGCDSYITKPIKKEDIMKIIDQYVSNKS